MSDDYAASELNQAIAICRDGIKFYEQASQRIDDPHMQGLFGNMVQLRKETVAELAPFVQGMGHDVKTSGTAAGAVHRTLAKFAAKLSKDETAVLLTQLAEAEAWTLSRLQEIVEEPISDAARSVLAQKLEMFRSTYHQMQTLNEAEAEGR